MARVFLVVLGVAELLPFIQIATRETECPDWQQTLSLQIKTQVCPKIGTPGGEKREEQKNKFVGGKKKKKVVWQFQTVVAHEMKKVGYHPCPRQEDRPHNLELSPLTCNQIHVG